MRVPTQPRAGRSKELILLYAESINMLDGLADDKVDRYLEEHLKIVPLFEVDMAEVVTHREGELTSRMERRSGNCGKCRNQWSGKWLYLKE